MLGDIVMSVITGMHSLFGLEGMLGVLIGFMLYALYSNLKSQVFKLIVIIVLILIIWGVAYYLSTGEPVDVPPANETLSQIISTIGGNTTQTTTITPEGL